MRLFTAFLFSLVALAQQPTAVVITNNSQLPVTSLYFYDANSNIQYICRAPLVDAYVWAVTPNVQKNQGTLTSIVVLTNVGTATTAANHGIQIGNVVTVSGSTTAALNGTYQVKTVPSATTFTITTAGVADATYNSANLTLATNAPRSNVSQWSIAKYNYYGVSGEACPYGVTGPTNSICSSQWATNLSSGQGGSFAYQFSCDARATQSYQ